jgi:hypothetical protein
VDKTNASDTEKEFIAVYSDNCTNCSHLIPSKPKKFSTCHFSKGNVYCPASELKIVVVGKAYRYAKIVLNARTVRDAKTEARILGTVAKQSQEFQERFYAALENPSEITE